ncbi:hypothetical protein Pint_13654 [Pistacia integerrima]|uniref:Uncharacterized protein n=1 Tax=Pistacia integerrima TaxID=434235 RepID=A0ACC0Y486_9ROSI|nr:hypothetical protein Pint_13654 [Pistacia integerrima]
MVKLSYDEISSLGLINLTKRGRIEINLSARGKETLPTSNIYVEVMAKSEKCLRAQALEKIHNSSWIVVGAGGSEDGFESGDVVTVASGRLTVAGVARLMRLGLTYGLGNGSSLNWVIVHQIGLSSNKFAMGDELKGIQKDVVKGNIVESSPSSLMGLGVELDGENKVSQFENIDVVNQQPNGSPNLNGVIQYGGNGNGQNRSWETLSLDKVTQETCKFGVGRIGYARVLMEVDAARRLQECVCVGMSSEDNSHTKIMEVRVEFQWHPSQFNKHMERRELWNRGRAIVTPSMKNFRNCVEELEVDDIIKLVLCSPGMGISDHSPSVIALLQCVALKPRPLKFFNYLVYKEGFLAVIKKMWATKFSIVSMFQVVKKLKVLKLYLKELNRKQGDLNHKVVIIRKEVENIQKVLDLDPRNEDLRETEVVFSGVFRMTLLDEERFLK